MTSLDPMTADRWQIRLAVGEMEVSHAPSGGEKSLAHCTGKTEWYFGGGIAMFGTRFTQTVVITLLGIFPVVGTASELALVPIAATGPHTIAGNEIVLAGGGQTVTFEIHASDWEPELLRGVQVVIDMNGLVSGMAGTALPLGWDRVPGDGMCLVTPCASDAECPPGFTCFDGNGIGSTCNGPDHDPELGAFIDTTHPGYVFNGLQVLTAMDHLCYRYLSIVTNAAQSAEFTPPPKYVGSLVLVVSDDAEGTFTIGFEEDQCLFAYGPEESVVPSTFSPGVIRIVHPVCGNGACEPSEGETNCPTDCGGSIPTVSVWGMLVMALTLAVGAKVCFDRGRAGTRTRLA